MPRDLVGEAVALCDAPLEYNDWRARLIAANINPASVIMPIINQKLLTWEVLDANGKRREQPLVKPKEVE